MAVLDEFKVGFIISPDGTKIGYRQTGTGPGLIVVHGGLQSSLNFTAFAKALSGDFTVYVPDRRGRGLSGPYNDRDNLLSEANDLLALIHHTNTHYVFGLSAGAIVSLQAALMEPALKKLALYEPPIPVYGNPFKKLDNDYGRAISKGNLGKAFLAILKGTGDPDISILNTLPAFITAPIINMMMRSQMKNRVENEIPLQESVLTFRHDLVLIKESAALSAKAKNIQADVLLLYGSKSQKYFKPVIDQLYASLPNARRVEFKKMGHLAADNSENPVKVAQVLLHFLKG